MKFVGPFVDRFQGTAEHQLLRSRVVVEIPARPFLGLAGEDETELLALAEDYAVEAGGAGFA